GDVLAVEEDAAGVGPELPADDVEDRRLARAVGPDQRNEAAARDREVHRLGGDDAAKGLAQPFRRQQGHAPSLELTRQRAARPTRAAPPPTRPRGNASTMAMMASPSSRRQESVSGITKSRMAWNTLAPTSGPAMLSTPPSRTITRKSTDVGIDSKV